MQKIEKKKRLIEINMKMSVHEFDVDVMFSNLLQTLKFVV